MPPAAFTSTVQTAYSWYICYLSHVGIQRNLTKTALLWESLRQEFGLGP